MKEILKIKFCDFWGDLDKENNLFTELLTPYYEVKQSENPDVLFYSCYSFNHLKYKCHKIFYTGENVRPDFNECDFSLSFDWNDYKKKNFRLPLFAWSPSLAKLCKKLPSKEIAATKSKFCCFVVGNQEAKERIDFFHKLSQYRKVDSGGSFMNNVGKVYSQAEKRNFIKDYKFIIAFENSCYPGYTSEKILQPMQVNCLPVYWGNPAIGRDFNTKSFINVHDYNSFDEVIEEIIKIDTDDQLYYKYLDEPYFTNDRVPATLERDFMAEELKNIIESFEDTKPVSSKSLKRIYQYAHMYKRRFFARVYQKQHWYC
ncbi:MAG TPA: glycosyltransferase family 10 [Chitinophagaceae bacterium]|nr:glycosyltransferase family 10 [Chitinophagaceae bacterium]